MSPPGPDPRQPRWASTPGSPSKRLSGDRAAHDRQGGSRGAWSPLMWRSQLCAHGVQNLYSPGTLALFLGKSRHITGSLASGRKRWNSPPPAKNVC